MKFKKRYRLGLDIGTNSIGWCVLQLSDDDQPIGIIRAGSRIFSDGRSPKTLASLAADRRAARQMRRRHDRVLKRMARFMDGLVRFGLLPNDDGERLALSALDPYELRRKGLDESLTAFELGRALYHLAKRRGFKSSRKSKGEDENEAGKIATAIIKTREQIKTEGCRTMGEYLAKRHAQRETVRARTTADGKEYLLYTQRAMVAEEFDALWAAQAAHHPNICTEEARAFLRDTLLFQRPLLPVQPGRCIFEVEEFREPLWSPLQQQFRVLQELNNLRVIDGLEERPLTLEERNTLRDALYRYVKGDGNYCYDIYRLDNGRWGGDVVDIYTANRPGFGLRSKEAYKSGKPLVMRLRQGDILKLEHDGRYKLMCVAQFSDGKIIMSEHNEANADARNRLRKEQARKVQDGDDVRVDESFQYLQKSPDGLRQLAARLVGVDVLGYVNDTGFKA
jgi:CRISPR-associated endonuclease Csn1